MEYDLENFNIEIQKENPNSSRNVEEILNLWLKMDQGDTEALMKLSLFRGMINQEEYDDLEFNKY